ncbi:acyl-CoA thioesterase [Kingella kingae]|uniref:4-hydroxybenzoyl-CoA thioesterase domain protein n=2 Tax=Kingella kingae TaxID=504 RepID=F5S7E7_KINKI|nr:acyl-CoA thioesterase [Kingella kingae]EGK09087.1 4-hydroxybenzoyl-CoA thioesterase domain protein [Kingella kingae ATCC 23330]MDK4534328.1 acyl-CoA thioesterase [Kingella kingae]MDK4540810.1 acyl-CoA thioesterase [Kingella kingae]MDK4553348.1 acyl-CoA thioesterase [Kingella kingae]MDK4661285.1 acyl-CoA thioesterase [Kingella kingae]
MKPSIFCIHSLELDVPFFDVDSLFIVWHGHYVKYFEMARCAFLAEIQHDYNVMRETGFAYPIVKLDVKYIKPATFGQKIRVEMAVVEFESCLKVNYTITDVKTGTKLTKASTTQVAVRIDNGKMQFQTPDVFQAAIRQFAGFNAI